MTVRRREREEDESIAQRPVAAFRTRWTIETKSFFEERAAAAEIVRNDRVTPAEAVRAEAQLAKTYLGIRAAELVAEKTLNRVEDRRRFVTQVREVLAWRFERGEPAPSVKLRMPTPDPQRSPHTPPHAPDPPELSR